MFPQVETHKFLAGGLLKKYAALLHHIRSHTGAGFLDNGDIKFEPISLCFLVLEVLINSTRSLLVPGL